MSDSNQLAAARLASDASRGLMALITPTDFKTGDRALARWHTGGFVSGTVRERAQTGAGWWFKTDDGREFVAQELHKPEPIVHDYAAERALIDAKHLLQGLDADSVTALGLGRIPVRALQLASKRCGIRILRAEHLDDIHMAEELSELLRAGRIIWEAQTK